MSEVTTFQLPVKQLGDEVLWEGHYKKVKMDIYWDSHGQKVYSESHPCREFTEVDVKIVCHKRVVDWGDGSDPVPWDEWKLFVDAKSVGPIEGYNAKKTVIHIDAPWGAG